MKQNPLALFGGPKAISKAFNRYNSIGPEEVQAAKNVVESGNLSQFLGSWGPDFYGGSKVQEFERACEAFFKVKHAVTVNSLTSGLTAAVGAIGIEPGDEVIVSPWTMAASATAIIHWNAIPVFADVEADTFCLDPLSVEANITPNTKAIMAVDIFGQSADVASLMEIADRHNLKVISDTAQAPGALYGEKYTGTLTHVGGFSLNYHKHIHTGEGAIMVTNEDDIAERMQLIRNHAEVVVEKKGVTNLSNMIGHNFRLGEIESAIGIEQLKKLPDIIKGRQELAKILTDGLSELKGLTPAVVRQGNTHSYYVYPMTIDANLGVSRDKIHEALMAEGVIVEKTLQLLHLIPMYQKKIAYGSKGFPWSSDICRRDINYAKGICPTAEDLIEHSYMAIGMCLFDYDQDDMKQIVKAFQKVWANLDLLK